MNQVDKTLTSVEESARFLTGIDHIRNLNSISLGQKYSGYPNLKLGLYLTDDCEEKWIDLELNKGKLLFGHEAPFLYQFSESKSSSVAHLKCIKQSQLNSKKVLHFDFYDETHSWEKEKAEVVIFDHFIWQNIPWNQLTQSNTVLAFPLEDSLILTGGEYATDILPRSFHLLFSNVFKRENSQWNESVSFFKNELKNLGIEFKAFGACIDINKQNEALFKKVNIKFSKSAEGNIRLFLSPLLSRKDAEEIVGRLKV